MLTARTVSPETGLPSTVMTFTVCGCRILRSSALAARIRMTTRETFSPPPVDPALAPTIMREHQDHAGKLRPKAKILRTEARCRDDGGDGKGRVMQAEAEIAAVELHDVAGDEQRRAENDRHVPAQLRILPHEVEFPPQDEKIDREIHAEQRHKNGRDGLRVNAVGGEGIVADGKAARTGRAEGVAERVKQRLAAGQIKRGSAHRQAK